MDCLFLKDGFDHRDGNPDHTSAPIFHGRSDSNGTALTAAGGQVADYPNKEKRRRNQKFFGDFCPVAKTLFSSLSQFHRQTDRLREQMVVIFGKEG